jgi:uncharacterized protein (TIGR00297 family)
MVSEREFALLVNVVFSLGFAFLAFGAGVLDLLGSALAFALAVLILQTVGFLYLALLIAFVALGFAVTKLFYKRKQAMGVAEAKSGTRGWRNVAANGGVPAIIAGLTLLNWPAEHVALGFIAAISTASADTFASELGVLSRRVYLITKPPGPRREQLGPRRGPGGRHHRQRRGGPPPRRQPHPRLDSHLGRVPRVPD